MPNIKHIIHDITRQRLSRHEQLYIVIHPSIESLLKAYGASIHWNDVFPGAVIKYHTLCGLPYEVSAEVDEYKVMTKEELLRWENEHKYSL